MLENQGLIDAVLNSMIGLFGEMINSTQYGLYDQGYFVRCGREINFEGKADVILAVQFLVW